MRRHFKHQPVAMDEIVRRLISGPDKGAVTFCLCRWRYGHAQTFGLIALEFLT